MHLYPTQASLALRIPKSIKFQLERCIPCPRDLLPPSSYSLLIIKTSSENQGLTVASKKTLLNWLLNSVIDGNFSAIRTSQNIKLFLNKIGPDTRISLRRWRLTASLSWMMDRRATMCSSIFQKRTEIMLKKSPPELAVLRLVKSGSSTILLRMLELRLTRLRWRSKLR